MGCQTSSQRSLSGPFRTPQIEFQTFNAVVPVGTSPPYVIRDFFCGFTRPHKFFFFASIAFIASGSDFFVHLSPLGLSTQNPGTQIVPTGGENWIPIYNGLNRANPYAVEGRWFRFNKPVSGFYVDTDHPNGGVSVVTFTIGGTDDIEAFAGERL